MVEFTRITEANFKWFSGMLPEEMEKEKTLQSKSLMLGALCDGTACGIIVIGYENGMSELRWLYVVPEFRKRGIGESLLREIETEKKAAEIRQTMAVYLSDDNGWVMDRLLNKNGYSISAVRSNDYGISYRKMIGLSAFRHMAEAKVSPKYRFQVLEKAPSFIAHNPEINSGFNYEAYKKYSVVCYDDKRLAGYLMIDEKNDAEHEMSYLKTYENQSLAVLIGLFWCFADNIIRKMKSRNLAPDAVLSFQLLDRKKAGFVSKVLGLQPSETVWFHVAKNEQGD